MRVPGVPRWCGGHHPVGDAASDLPPPVVHRADQPELMFALPSLDSTLSVLSAMITPAVMILATSSLILTTTNRLVRIVDRVREMLPESEALAHAEQPDEMKRVMLFEDLGRA